MEPVASHILFLILFTLILLSAFFSSSETSMMSINRYRLRHLSKSGHRGALKVHKLLSRPDRLIGVILIGNNFVNILASSIATVLAVHWLGDKGIAVAALSLTLIILIFAEVTPKTLAVLNPEKIAFVAAYFLQPLLYVLYPFVWLVNSISNSLLKILKQDPRTNKNSALDPDELRTVVDEASALIPNQHKTMLLSILDLEKATVMDIMIPRNEVFGIDIEDSMANLLHQLQSSHHTRIPVFKGNLNNPVGILHAKKLAKFLSSKEEKNKANLLQYTAEPYYVVQHTPLHKQLAAFKLHKRRFALVVDEYGDVQGIATLEDLLEEIVGEFTTDLTANQQDIHLQKNGSYLIDGSVSIRDINRTLNWDLPIDGPKTLNGLITEHLESIPQANVGLRINNFLVEVLKVKDNLVKTARVTQQENISHNETNPLATTTENPQ